MAARKWAKKALKALTRGEQVFTHTGHVNYLSEAEFWSEIGAIEWAGWKLDKAASHLKRHDHNLSGFYRELHCR